MKTKTILPRIKGIGIAVFVLGAFVVYGNSNLVNAQTSTTTATTTQNQATTTTATTTAYKIKIMKHLCPSYIKDMNDFNNLMANRDDVTAFLNVEFHCPTSVLSSNTASSDSIQSQKSTFNFDVKNQNDSATSSRTLQSNAVFVPGKVCESDINRDINLNSMIASSTCLDASHYEFNVNSTSSLFTISESTYPNEYHFGTVLFTPPALSSNNDSQNLVGTINQTGVINLDMATDTDKTIVLHVFNFRHIATTGGATTSTSTTEAQLINLANQISLLQTKIDNLITQIQNLINRLNNNPGTGSGGGGGVVDSVARVRAAYYSTVMGDTNDFAGDHFGPSEQVVISTEGQTIMTVTTDKEGNFGTGSIYMPRAIGDKVYTFRGLTSGKQVNVTVRILPIP